MLLKGVQSKERLPEYLKATSRARAPTREQTDAEILFRKIWRQPLQPPKRPSVADVTLNSSPARCLSQHPPPPAINNHPSAPTDHNTTFVFARSSRGRNAKVEGQTNNLVQNCPPPSVHLAHARSTYIKRAFKCSLATANQPTKSN